MAKPRIGFIGAGYMGEGMATNLVRKGFPLTVMAHRNRAPIERLKKRGAAEAKTPAEVMAASDIVILCLPGSTVVEPVIKGKGGLLEAARAGAIVIDASTSEPRSTVALTRELKRRRMILVDAPVTRGPKAAMAGKLCSIIGADAATFKRVKPVISAYSEKLYHVGPVGRGHVVKLLNNTMTIANLVASAETLVAAKRLGVDIKLLAELVAGSFAQSRTFAAMAGWVLKPETLTDPSAVSTALKDVSYYDEMAREAGMSPRIAAAARLLLGELTAQGLGDATQLELIAAIARRAGFAFKPAAKARKPATARRGRAG